MIKKSKIQEIFEKVLKEKENEYTDEKLEEIRKEREYVKSIINEGIEKSENIICEIYKNI
ncbi:hypothetical protein [Campylobacter jejuni]|uniref:hypothetical protein n=1 Tax=Campylobacter jejuni TaxID=197 RepID=UPI000F80D2EA|nr:hypothetical protein [Campylobacter jejuni]RTH89319.1 hypothetical protein C3I33_09130 [Campylobacter jejuni]RTH91812.1 hypothetical protein C3I35_08935 [Campylobacter jejuni]RTI53655.1 hypothetical protein C3I22_09485 [Campylobacter jejuni]